MDDSMQLLSTVEETSKNACRGPVFSHLPVRRCSYLERALACGFGLQSHHDQKPPKCCLVSFVLLEEAWGGNDSNDTCIYLYGAYKVLSHA